MNDYIREALLKFDDGTPPQALNVICECDQSCIRLVTIDFDVYEQVRRTPGWAVISPDHDHESLGEMVRNGDSYRVVRWSENRDELIARRPSTAPTGGSCIGRLPGDWQERTRVLAVERPPSEPAPHAFAAP